MSKILAASCVAGVVTVEGYPITCEVLSQGTKSSTGVVLLDGEVARYLPSSVLDVKELIESMDTILQKIIQIATQLDAVTVSPGAAAANIALLTAMQVQLALTKDNLR